VLGAGPEVIWLTRKAVCQAVFQWFRARRIFSPPPPRDAPVTATAPYEIRRLRGEDELAAALELRHDVFCVEQGVPEHEELDGRDREGIHLVAVSEDGQLLATCRLLMVGATAQFSRLAVRVDARRRGIATALLDLAEAETRAAGGRRLVLHAQTYARELYEQAGYRARGRVFWEAGIEHVAMEKTLD
jgi:predicted GNAT family N-acyltransferase